MDSLGRKITYLRLSVTDRCNLRCSYCMGEDVTFVPRNETLRTEEMVRLCGIFADLGIRTIRLTGGEPLTRPHVLTLAQKLGEWVGAGKLSELTLTTNGTRLPLLAEPLFRAGVRRINVSLDTLDPQTFLRITRHYQLEQVLDGIRAAQDAGMSVRINTVVLGGINDHEINRLIAWSGDHGCDMSLIEAMPMGGMAAVDGGIFRSLEDLRGELERHWSLLPSEVTTPGPSRYYTVGETGRRLGFITPMSHGFCGSCNRVRLTCTGRLHLCLARETGVELRPLLRESEDDGPVRAAIVAAMDHKPGAHDLMARELPARTSSVMWRLGG